MKAKKLFFLLGGFLLIGFAANAFFRQKNTENTKNKSFAVVELFTSEGCSSCPPADALVAKIEAESIDKPVFILAFHVDYWDRLGWKDVFSSPDFSKRQNQYANWLKLESVYTPQIVVNGQTEFVGSQENSLRNAIKNSLNDMPSAVVNLANIKVEDGKASLRYNVENITGSAVSLILTVVQKSAITNVQRGENSGKKLTHVQIVRNFESIPLTGKTNGMANIALPQKIDVNEMEIIALLQNTANGKIIAATKATF